MVKRGFRSPKSLLAALALTPLFGPFGSPPAHACGTIHDWLAKYEGAGGSDAQRESALQELAVACADYAGKASDPQLLEVLRDAVARHLDRGLIQSVFDTYRCLSGVREGAGYGDLAAALDTSACPSGEQLEAWYESSVDDALIRRGPERSADRIGWLHKGAVVEKLGVEGDWMRIRTWTGQTGYVHTSLLAKY